MRDIAALIEFVCTTQHERRAEPSVTLEQRSWAYCPFGASDGHVWSRIDPTGIETLRSPSGNGRARLVPEGSGERSTAGGPGR